MVFADGLMFRGAWEDGEWLQSAAEPALCRMAGEGLRGAVAGQRAEFVIQVGAAAAVSCCWSDGRMFVTTGRRCWQRKQKREAANKAFRPDLSSCAILFFKCTCQPTVSCSPVFPARFFTAAAVPCAHAGT